jgi:hypothetical protein
MAGQWKEPTMTAAAASRRADVHRQHPTLIQRVAAIVAVTFGVLGLLGFLPGVTADLALLEFAGDRSEARLFGLFSVSVVHNVLFLMLAVAGLAMALTVAGARSYLRAAGVLFLALWLYGLIVDRDSGANFLAQNSADVWLDLVLGLGLLALGLVPAGIAERPVGEEDAP